MVRRYTIGIGLYGALIALTVEAMSSKQSPTAQKARALKAPAVRAASELQRSLSNPEYTISSASQGLLKSFGLLDESGKAILGTFSK